MAARWPVEWRETVLSSGTISHFALVDPDALLDDLTQEEFDRSDGRMPYWATVWPSALSLADVVLLGPGLAGRRVLDLGCGLGLVGLAALDRGAHVTFLDWEAAATTLARASAWACGFGAVEVVTADWREVKALEPFDLVLGADVLYEARNAPAVAAFLAAHLRAGAEAWITDPDRRHARDFPAIAADAGLVVLERRARPPVGGAASLTLWRLARAASPGG